MKNRSKSDWLAVYGTAVVLLLLFLGLIVWGCFVDRSSSSDDQPRMAVAEDKPIAVTDTTRIGILAAEALIKEITSPGDYWVPLNTVLVEELKNTDGRSRWAVVSRCTHYENEDIDRDSIHAFAIVVSYDGTDRCVVEKWRRIETESLLQK
ncbi:MAG: hypothetical protein ACYTFA_17325 [Planctomycetota bacterium]